MICRSDGTPWFIHGIAFDITDLKQTEQELQEERNVVSAILDTVGALVVVLDHEGRIVRLNRVCEQMTGKTFEQAKGKNIWDLFLVPQEKEQFLALFQQIGENRSRTEYESSWMRKRWQPATIAWSACTSARRPANSYLHHCVRHRRHRAEACPSQISWFIGGRA